MKQGSSPGGDAVAHERGHLLGLDPVEQSVEGRHETWVLEATATPSLMSMTTGLDVNLSNKALKTVMKRGCSNSTATLPLMSVTTGLYLSSRTATDPLLTVTRFVPRMPNSCSSSWTARRRCHYPFLTATRLPMNVTRFVPMVLNSCSSLWSVVKKL